jgi:hypothetical protein
LVKIPPSRNLELADPPWVGILNFPAGPKSISREFQGVEEEDSFSHASPLCKVEKCNWRKVAALFLRSELLGLLLSASAFNSATFAQN